MHEGLSQMVLPLLQAPAGLSPASVHAAQVFLQLLDLWTCFTLQLPPTQIQTQHQRLIVCKSLLYVLFNTKERGVRKWSMDR